MSFDNSRWLYETETEYLEALEIDEQINKILSERNKTTIKPLKIENNPYDHQCLY